MPLPNGVYYSRAGVNKLSPMGQTQYLPPVLVNKVLLAQSHTHLFTYCQWLLSPVIAELRNCGRDPFDPQSQKYLLISALKKVCSPMS